jgi:hypothetical protein
MIFTDAICITYYIIDLIFLSIFINKSVNDDICKIGDSNIFIFLISYVVYSLLLMIINRYTDISKVFSIILYIIQFCIYMICTLGFFLSCDTITSFNFNIFIIYFNIASNIVIFVYEIGMKYKVGWVINEESRYLL